MRGALTEAGLKVTTSILDDGPEASAPREPAPSHGAERLIELELRPVGLATWDGDAGVSAPEQGRWVAALARAEPRDVLVAAPGSVPRPLSGLARGARVGALDPLRRELIRVHRPDLEVVELGRSDPVPPWGADGLLDADALARAGVVAAVVSASAARRGGLSASVGEVFEPAAWLTAPGQDGCVLVRRSGTGAGLDTTSMLRHVAAMVDDVDTRVALTAELAVRSALAAVPGAPLGVLARTHGPLLRVRAMVPGGDGRRLVRAEVSGPADDPETTARRVAETLLSRGAAALLP